MNLPSILLIPDRFMDYRMWSDISDRLLGRAEIVHYDQHEQIRWIADSDQCVDAARRLAPGGRFHLAAGAGQAARFAFAVAEAGLAKGLVLFTPSFDRLPDDVHVDWSAVDEGIDLVRPIVEAIDEPDPARQQDILLQVLRASASADGKAGSTYAARGR